MLAATCISIFMVPATFTVVEKVSHYLASRGEKTPPTEGGS